MKDLIVVIPGITGSELALNGKPVWGLSGQALMLGVLTLGKRVERLKLPDGFGDSLPTGQGDGEPDDGVRPTGLMTDLHVIPGMWAPIKGYGLLTKFFAENFSVTTPTQERPG